jgi:hypothetical protein
MVTWKRTLRTPSSERFVAQKEGRDVAAVDLHYLPNGTVSGTVIVLTNANWTDTEIPKLLAMLDEDFLPEVDLARGNLTFTVVRGDIVGNFEATENADKATMRAE